jgi:hypothetical protein
LTDKRLQEIFKEACQDSGSSNLDECGFEARMRLGIKISKENINNEIKIYDYSSGGNYYIEMKKNQLYMINKKGWTKGVITLTLDKYKNKLEKIKTSITKELNGNRRNKRLHYYKEARQQVLNKYYKLTQKLNKNET